MGEINSKGTVKAKTCWVEEIKKYIAGQSEIQINACYAESFKDLKEGKELRVEALGSNMPSVRVFDLKQGSKRKEALEFTHGAGG